MICIYKITSPSGKIYIGQTVNFIRRKASYKNLKCKSQKKLYSSFIKYGFDNHLLEVLEECDIDKLNEKERYYQEKYNVTGKNGLNLLLTKTNDKSGLFSEESRFRMSISQTGKKLSESTRAKMSSRIVSEETRQKMRNSMKGKKQSLEAIEKSRIARTGLKRTPEQIERVRKNRTYSETPIEVRKKISDSNKGKIVTKETRQKLSIAKTERSLKYIINLESGIFHLGINEACLSYGISKGVLSKMLSGFRKNKTNLIYA